MITNKPFKKFRNVPSMYKFAKDNKIKFTEEFRFTIGNDRIIYSSIYQFETSK